MADRIIDRITAIYVDGRIVLRCYTGNNFVDAKISLGCLVNLISDGGQIVAALYQDKTSAAVSEKA